MTQLRVCTHRYESTLLGCCSTISRVLTNSLYGSLFVSHFYEGSISADIRIHPALTSTLSATTDPRAMKTLILFRDALIQLELIKDPKTARDALRSQSAIID